MYRLSSHIYRLLPVLLLAVWAGCSRTPVNEDAIYICDDMEVYPDSMVIDGRQYTAVSRSEITNAWQADAVLRSHVAGLPALSSSSRMADALYTKGISRYNEENLSTLDIYLAGAILDPERSMLTLRNMVSDGVVHRRGFPLETDKEAWAAAALELYYVTGSEEWLKEAYNVILLTHRREYPVLRAGNGLIYGPSAYMRFGKGYFPSWMEPVDQFQTINLSTNAWYYATLNSAAQMARMLRRKLEREWEDQASASRSAINDAFWVPAASSYGQYLYGDYYPILSPAADNYANPLTVILGIATPEMGARLMESRTMLPKGWPTVYPTPADGETCIDPRVQTLQGIAAARTGNENALLASIGTVWRMSLGERDHCQWPTLLLRGIMGITLSEEGMAFNPTIPDKIGPNLTLSGLCYRQATLDVNIQGSGDKIASFAIDSVRQPSPVVSPATKGHHRIDIVMAGNKLSPTPASSPLADRQEPAPGMPRLYWSDERNGKILNFDPATTYEIYLNGILSENLNAAQYSVTDSGTTIVAIVPVRNGVSGFSPRSHISAAPEARIHIPATAITPRRPPLHLIRHRETATHYIELAARHNTRLTFYVQAPADGQYFINIAYANGTTDTAMRKLEVNDMYAGTLVCPAISHNDWITTRRSSTISASLRQGVNKLSLTYVNSTILLHDIYLLKK